MAQPQKPQPQIKNPDAGKIKVIVSGPIRVTSTNPKVVVVKGE